MSGKGSTIRPRTISQDQWDNRISNSIGTEWCFVCKHIVTISKNGNSVNCTKCKTTIRIECEKTNS